MQIDSTPRNYRRIPITDGDGLQMELPTARTRAPRGLRCSYIEGDGMQKKDKIYRLSYSNYDIIEWVKYLKIEYNLFVFNQFFKTRTR